MSVTLSRRCSESLTEDCLLLETLYKVSDNLYNEISNTGGVVNLGSAEITLAAEERYQKISHLPVITKETSCYFRTDGLQSFNEALAEFFTERFNAAEEVNPAHITVLPGVSSCLDALAHALADPGEYFLAPFPFYSRIENDMEDKSKVHIYGIPLTSKMEEGDTEPFQLTVGKIQKAYDEAISKGLKVRGIVITTPNNPIGVIYSKQLMMDILQFAKRHELHVVSDEMYAVSLYNTDEKFTSVLSVKDLPDPERTHMMWGFSKCFGLTGFRCAAIHSRNERIHEFLNSTSYFTTVPYIAQSMLERMIRDKDWLDTVYFPTLFSSMRDNFDIFASSFKKLDIPIFVGSGRATCFVWANFSKYIHPTKEGEYQLFYTLLEAGVYIVPGCKLGCSEFGWFRITFTNYKGHVLKAVERMEKLFHELDTRPPTTRRET